MAAPRFAIGTTNIIQYIAEEGLTFDTEDIDAPGSGRTLDGKMHRNRVATKKKITVRFRPLSGSEITTVRNLMNNQTFSVKYYDIDGSQVTKTMYKGTDTYNLALAFSSLDGLYRGYEVHLIEV